MITTNFQRMLSNISWYSFFMSIGVLVVLYYAAILLLFYRKPLLQLLKGGIRFNTPEPVPETRTRGALFTQVHELMKELQDQFSMAAQQRHSKDALLVSLGRTLQKNQNLKGTSFEEAIHTHIVQTALSQCNIQLDDADVHQAW